jgi:hypothetical protein
MQAVGSAIHSTGNARFPAMPARETGKVQDKARLGRRAFVLSRISLVRSWPNAAVAKPCATLYL